MKTKKVKKISLLLAAATLTAALGGAMIVNGVTASAEAATYTLTDVFSVTKAEIKTEGDNKTTAFAISDEGKVVFKRNLAFKWYEESGAKFFSLKFAFNDLDFESVSISLDSPSAWATKDNKATNVVKFTKESDKYYVAVNDSAKTEVTLTAGQPMTLSFKDGVNDGEFGVTLDDNDIGVFENVGANYAEYSYNETYPLTISADLGSGDEVTDKKTTVLVHEINGQSFNNVSTENKVTDNAKPVLVVNEEIFGFQLGAAFALDYTVVDVLQSKNLTKTLEYYQYNPNKQEQTYTTLSTSTYFLDTTYKVGDKDTTVFKEYGAEYVSIKLTVADDTYSEKEGEFAKPVYDLAWYAEATRVKSDFGDDLNYIPVDRNEDGATYRYITANEGTNQNDVAQTELDAAKASFDEALEEAAKDVFAGSNSTIYFPSFSWLIDDNNGYRNLKFTISYRTPGSDSESTSSSLSYNNLKLSVDKEGVYEFKIFANDKLGNTMKYYYEDELVDVTSSNVWKIEEIPYFTFEIKNAGLKVEDPSASNGRKETEVLNKTFSVDEFTVIGATDLQQAYALYKVDLDAYNKNATKLLTVDHLSSVTYEELANKLVNVDLAAEKDKFAAYLNAYATLLGEKIGVEAKAILDSNVFVKISEEGDRINGKETDDVYAWNATAKSFKTAEVGQYIVMADFWEGGIPAQRATAYKLIVVESESAVIKGETEWLKNNVVSVVLFSIAGVMLILIIILLLVKPSDETLEDVDVKAVEKKQKKTAKKENKD